MRCSPSPSLVPLSSVWDRSCPTSLHRVRLEQPEHKAPFPVGTAQSPETCPTSVPQPGWVLGEHSQTCHRQSVLPAPPKAARPQQQAPGDTTSSWAWLRAWTAQASPRAQGREGPPVLGSTGRERRCQHLGHPCMEYFLVPFTERSLQIAQV